MVINDFGVKEPSDGDTIDSNYIDVVLGDLRPDSGDFSLNHVRFRGSPFKKYS